MDFLNLWGIALCLQRFDGTLLVTVVDCRMIGFFGSRSGRSIVVCLCTSLSRLRRKGVWRWFCVVNRADCCMIEIFVNLDPGRKMEDFCPVGFVRMGSSEFGSVRP